jgi:hypothetical protein
MMKKVFVAGLVLGVVACASTSSRDGFGEQKPAGEEGTKGPEGTFDPGTGACVGLECKKVACPSGGTTTLSGRVYDPAGANPLYNAIVYIPSGENPNGPLPPLKSSGVDGVACEPCAGVVLNPLTSALTDENGHFELKDVPVDKKVPVVIQIGKWRRKIQIDVTKNCADNPVPDRTLTLPRNGGEGDMPQIAVTTGGADALECLLHGIGVDDSEFVAGPGGSGHVHVFNGINGRYQGAPDAAPLWNDAAALKKYDIALLSCEGGEHLENKGEGAPTARSGMVDYLDAGGRVFATHFHYVWFKDSPSKELRDLASFADNLPAPTKGIHDVDMSFAKGAAFGNWLKAVDASKDVGKIDLTDVLDTVSTVHAPAIPWIKSAGGKPRYFSVNTPIGTSPDKQCGRAVYSDLHITNAAGPTTAEACKIASGALSPQQKALEFFLFDLSACISDDRVPPTPPK